MIGRMRIIAISLVQLHSLQLVLVALLCIMHAFEFISRMCLCVPSKIRMVISSKGPYIVHAKFTGETT